MLTRVSAVLTVVVLMCAVTATGYAITPYSQDFESLTVSDPNALSNDGWLVYGNVYSPTMTYLYGYGPYPAPNHNLAFSQIVTGEGGIDQGDQQLSVFSDYENTDQAIGNIIESNVYREWTVAAADTGLVWTFAFQAKLGNLEGASTAAAFIKTLDPNNGYALTHFETVDMTSIPATWGGYSVQLYVDSSLVGQIFQIGFLNTATNYEGSGVFYDNVVLSSMSVTGVPAVTPFAGGTLAANYPNPFSPRTRIDFTMTSAGRAELSIFDLTGRKVASLADGVFTAGEHQVSWDGRTDAGAPAAAGQYWYVLRTPAGRVARSMTLLR